MRVEAGHNWCQPRRNTLFHACNPNKMFSLFEMHRCGKAVNLLWEDRMSPRNFHLPRSPRSARIHPRLRKTSLATGTPVDAVTRTVSTEWQAHLGPFGRGGEGHGVNPETDYSRKRLLWLCFSTVFPQLWK